MYFHNIRFNCDLSCGDHILKIGKNIDRNSGGKYMSTIIIIAKKHLVSQESHKVVYQQNQANDKMYDNDS